MFQGFSLTFDMIFDIIISVETHLNGKKGRLPLDIPQERTGGVYRKLPREIFSQGGDTYHFIRYGKYLQYCWPCVDDCVLLCKEKVSRLVGADDSLRL